MDAEKINFNTDIGIYRHDAAQPIARHNAAQPATRHDAARHPDSAQPVGKQTGTDKLEKAATCQTCENRRYQDVSNDSGVSMQAPTKIPPGMAAAAVMSHEREHYSREASRAEQEGREVLQNDIRIFTAICPECGKTYVSGGETRTVTRKRAESDVFLKNFFEQSVGRHLPKQFDAKV